MIEFELTGNAEPTIDTRDFQYISPFLPEELPQKIDLSDNPDLPNQGEQGACAANGNYFDIFGKVPSFESSRQFMHTSTKVMGGYRGQYGVKVRDSFQALHELGVCSEAEYPYSDDMNNQVPPPSAYASAINNRVEEYESVIPVGAVLPLEEKLHNLRSALHEGMVVGLGIRVTPSIFELKGPWLEHKYEIETKDNPATGRHYMSVVAVDMDKRMLKLANWWGPERGDKGYMGLPVTVLDSFRPEAWCTRSFKGVGTPERAGIFKSSLLYYGFSARLQVPPELHGTTTNVWAGAILPNGDAVIKHGQGDDSWKPISEGLPPFLTDYPLKKVSLLSLVNYVPDFASAIKGTKFYAGYGENVFSMKVNQVWTV